MADSDPRLQSAASGAAAGQGARGFGQPVRARCRPVGPVSASRAAAAASTVAAAARQTILFDLEPPSSAASSMAAGVDLLDLVAQEVRLPGPLPGVAPERRRLVGPAAASRRRAASSSVTGRSRPYASRARRWAAVCTRDRCWCWPCSSTQLAGCLGQGADRGHPPVDPGPWSDRPATTDRAEHDLRRRGRRPRRQPAILRGPGVRSTNRPSTNGLVRPGPHHGRVGAAAEQQAEGLDRAGSCPAPVSPVSAVIPGPRMTVTSSMTPRFAHPQLDEHAGPPASPYRSARWNLARRMAWKSRVAEGDQPSRAGRPRRQSRRPRVRAVVTVTPSTTRTADRGLEHLEPQPLGRVEHQRPVEEHVGRDRGQRRWPAAGARGPGPRAERL